MSVKQRGRKWHYRFCSLGKNYNGVCCGCTTKKEAEAYEAKIRKEAEAIRHHKTVASLVEDYRQELFGGEPIPIQNGFELAVRKPSVKSRESSSIDQRKSMYRDFCRFMQAEYPDIQYLHQVSKAHCESYISYLIENGRYDKEVVAMTTVKGRGRGLRRRTTAVPKIITYKQDYLLSSSTIRDFASVIKWVFSSLAEEAGIVRNPMENVVLPAKDGIDREIFTEKELALIRDNLKYDDVCRPLFTVAALTGLTEGDICTLKWSDISLVDRVIRRRRNKTGAYLEIPIGDALLNFIQQYPKVNEYVFADLAEMYKAQKISPRIKKFLDKLGIENTRKVAGRRAVSIKDLHSMRHVFCFYAGQAGIPITTVQSIVGHMTLEMTRHYSRHDSVASKQKAIEKLPILLSFVEDKAVKKPYVPVLSEDWDDTSDERLELIKLAKHLPIEKVRELLEKYK